MKKRRGFRVGKRQKRLIIAVVVVSFLATMIWYLHDRNFAVLNPKGIVAYDERKLMITTVLLGMIVVIPVYVMTFAIAWRYREGNKKARYSPELAGNLFAELLWWAIPLAIIGTLSVITWRSSHALDPRRPLNVSGRPLNVQVIALEWKWLFIYPEQNVASVNWLELPVGRPVAFDITADAPMNSFWIPQLGSQIYAMPGMSTQLHLVADQPGDYAGSSANLSGDGFAGMRFTAEAVSTQQFDNWVKVTKRSPRTLDSKAYDQLARPSQNTPVSVYSSADRQLYNKVLLKYMEPGGR